MGLAVMPAVSLSVPEAASAVFPASGITMSGAMPGANFDDILAALPVLSAQTETEAGVETPSLTFDTSDIAWPQGQATSEQSVPVLPNANLISVSWPLALSALPASPEPDDLTTSLDSSVSKEPASPQTLPAWTVPAFETDIGGDGTAILPADSLAPFNGSEADVTVEQPSPDKGATASDQTPSYNSQPAQPANTTEPESTSTVESTEQTAQPRVLPGTSEILGNLDLRDVMPLPVAPEQPAEVSGSVAFPDDGKSLPIADLVLRPEPPSQSASVSETDVHDARTNRPVPAPQTYAVDNNGVAEPVSAAPVLPQPASNFDYKPRVVQIALPASTPEPQAVRGNTTDLQPEPQATVDDPRNVLQTPVADHASGTLDTESPSSVDAFEESNDKPASPRHTTEAVTFREDALPHVSQEGDEATRPSDPAVANVSPFVVPVTPQDTGVPAFTRIASGTASDAAGNGSPVNSGEDQTANAPEAVPQRPDAMMAGAPVVTKPEENTATSGITMPQTAAMNAPSSEAPKPAALATVNPQDTSTEISETNSAALKQTDTPATPIEAVSADAAERQTAVLSPPVPASTPSREPQKPMAVQKDEADSHDTAETAASVPSVSAPAALSSTVSIPLQNPVPDLTVAPSAPANPASAPVAADSYTQPAIDNQTAPAPGSANPTPEAHRVDVAGVPKADTATKPEAEPETASNPQPARESQADVPAPAIAHRETQTSSASSAPTTPTAVTIPDAAPAPQTIAPQIAAASFQTNAATPDNAVTPGHTDPPVQLTLHTVAGLPDAADGMDALALRIMSKSADGDSRFEIRLDPPELGHIEVSLKLDSDGNAQADIRAEKPQTLDLLQRDAPALERALKDAGLSLPAGLSFSLKGDGRSNTWRDGQGNGRNRALQISSTDAIGAANTAVMAASLQAYGAANTRLDIRV